MKKKKLWVDIFKAFIKDAGVGTEYMGEISDCWVIAQLDNGLIIELFDRKCTNLESQINKTVDCLILAFYADYINSVDFTKGHDESKPILTGSFIGEYSIPKIWWNLKESLEYKKYPAVQTVNGILLMNFFQYPKDLKVGDIISFSVGRLDLIAWRPIEK